MSVFGGVHVDDAHKAVKTYVCRSILYRTVGVCVHADVYRQQAYRKQRRCAVYYNVFHENIICKACPIYARELAYAKRKGALAGAGLLLIIFFVILYFYDVFIFVEEVGQLVAVFNDRIFLFAGRLLRLDFRVAFGVVFILFIKVI